MPNHPFTRLMIFNIFSDVALGRYREAPRNPRGRCWDGKNAEVGAEGRARGLCRGSPIDGSHSRGQFTASWISLTHVHSPRSVTEKIRPSLIWRYWLNLLYAGSLCSLSVKTNWYCSWRKVSIRFVWHRKVCGPALYWTEVTEWIFHNWGYFDAARNRAN